MRSLPIREARCCPRPCNSDSGVQRTALRAALELPPLHGFPLTGDPGEEDNEHHLTDE